MADTGETVGVLMAAHALTGRLSVFSEADCWKTVNVLKIDVGRLSLVSVLLVADAGRLSVLSVADAGRLSVLSVADAGRLSVLSVADAGRISVLSVADAERLSVLSVADTTGSVSVFFLKILGNHQCSHG